MEAADNSGRRPGKGQAIMTPFRRGIAGRQAQKGPNSRRAAQGALFILFQVQRNTRQRWLGKQPLRRVEQRSRCGGVGPKPWATGHFG